MFHLSTLALCGVVVLAVGYYLYLAALPKPIPGIPYNEASAKRILGDAVDAIAEHKRTGDSMGWMTNQLIRHSKPVIQLFMRPLGKPWVILADFRETHDIMVRRTRYDLSNLFIDVKSVLTTAYVENSTAQTSLAIFSSAFYLTTWCICGPRRRGKRIAS